MLSALTRTGVFPAFACADITSPPTKKTFAADHIQPFRRSSIDNELKRDIAVLFLRVGVAFVFERAQGGDQPRARLSRLDHGIDVTALRGDIRIGEARAKLRDLLLPQPFALRFRRVFDLSLVDDVYRSLWAHHRDFRGGAGKIRVGAD